MATAHDVANYILKKLGRMTAMKLQKLVYYSQAWSLVWDERPLFPSRIEAWINGPVAPNLYEVHRGQFDVKEWPKGDSGKLTAVQRETVDAVLDFYGDKSSQWLSDLTHSEQPWKDARRGLAPTDRGGNEITHASMHEYYSSVASTQQA
ncbi:MAG: hypothetical protein QOC81_1770 [Thermoanaerobaculia bacterium]|jgi:uncharacterized phage-associated protein|nr:hypothetical protein [Thermoanaerobaculia bacterium]